MLKLYNYWSSTCSQKVRFCLHEKKLTFENCHINLFEFEHWGPEYARLNPKGVVPTLDHDGNLIIESNIILEYIEDVFPEIRLRPTDPVAAAKMRLWLYNAEEIAHPSVNVASHNLRHSPRLLQKSYSADQLAQFADGCPNPILKARFLERQGRGVSEKEENAAYDALDYLLDQMELALASGPWLAGNGYSLADISLAPYINRIEVLKKPEMLEPTRRPRVADWWNRIKLRAAFVAALSVENPDRSDPVRR